MNPERNWPILELAKTEGTISNFFIGDHRAGLLANSNREKTRSKKWWLCRYILNAKMTRTSAPPQINPVSTTRLDWLLAAGKQA